MKAKYRHEGVRKSGPLYRAGTIVRIGGRFHCVHAHGLTPQHARRRLDKKVEEVFRFHDYS